MPGNPLTKENFMEFWISETVSNVQNLIKQDISKVKDKINDLSSKIKKIENCQTQIEQSQSFLSSKYDQLMNAMQSAKKKEENHKMTMYDTAENISNVKDDIYNLQTTVDEVQKYLRHNCLEITGIPVVPGETTNNLVTQVADSIGVEIKANDIYLLLID